MVTDVTVEAPLAKRHTVHDAVLLPCIEKRSQLQGRGKTCRTTCTTHDVLHHARRSIGGGRRPCAACRASEAEVRRNPQCFSLSPRCWATKGWRPYATCRPSVAEVRHNPQCNSQPPCRWTSSGAAPLCGALAERWKLRHNPRSISLPPRRGDGC